MCRQRQHLRSPQHCPREAQPVEPEMTLDPDLARDPELVRLMQDTVGNQAVLDRIHDEEQGMSRPEDDEDWLEWVEGPEGDPARAEEAVREAPAELHADGDLEPRALSDEEAARWYDTPGRLTDEQIREIRDLRGLPPHGDLRAEGDLEPRALSDEEAARWYDTPSSLTEEQIEEIRRAREGALQPRDEGCVESDGACARVPDWPIAEDFRRFRGVLQTPYDENPCWVGSLPQEGHDGPVFCAGPGLVEASLYTHIEDGSRTDIGRVRNEVGHVEGPWGDGRIGLRSEAVGLRHCASTDSVMGHEAHGEGCVSGGAALAEASVGLEGATLAIQADAGAVDGTLGEFTADQDGELVVGAGASEGLGGRLSARYSDEDHDLGREYGLEVGYGPGSASVAYEPRHRPPTGPRPPRLESGAPPAHRGQR